MKRFATLALAAIFALSFSANVAAAPVFSGEFKVETEATVTEDSGVNFTGSPDAKLKLSAAEEGLWSLSVELGSVATSTTEVYVWKWDGGEPSDPDDKIGDLDKGKWETTTVTTNGVKIGKYYVDVTPGAFTFAAWGNDYELSDVADAFEFIKSGKKADDGPKFRLTTDVAGVGITADYDTTGTDKFFAFAKAGMFGVAFQDSNVEDSEAGMGASADVTTDLGIAKLTGGVAFDFQQPDTNGSLAFGIKAESEVAPGLTINGGYKSDGRGKPADYPTTEITAGAEYVLNAITIGGDLSLKSEDKGDKTVKDGDTFKTTTIGGSLAYGEIAEASVEYKTTNKQDDEDPTITIEASVDYPVIADVFTISADLKMINDKQAGHSAADDFTWVDPHEKDDFGEDVVTALEFSASADYKLTSAFTVTPGIKYAAYTFAGDAKATATTLSLDTTYAVSDAAEVTFGISNIKTEVDAGVPLPDATRTVLSTGITVKF